MFRFDWDNYKPPKPKIEKINFQSNIKIEEICKFIDWNPFFKRELYSKFPKILDDKIIGKAATDLWNDANKMLKKIIKEKITMQICFWFLAC